MALVVHGAATEKSEPVNAVTTEYCYSLDPVIGMEKYPHLQLYVHFKRKFKHQETSPYYHTLVECTCSTHVLKKIMANKNFTLMEKRVRHQHIQYHNNFY